MPIDKTNIIDVVSTDKITEDVKLTISDHLEWDNELYHLEVLQKKLNTYIAFIESGQIYKDYPNSNKKGKKLIIQILSKYEYPKLGLEFLEIAKPIISSIGAELKYKVG